MGHPRAVCLLFSRSDGKILAVSRKGDHTKFGLIGGKVDPGETVEQACVREAKEETKTVGYDGLEVKRMSFIFSRVCPGEVTYDSATYIATDSASDLPITPYVNSEGAVVDFVDEQTLLDGPFGEYNRALFGRVKVMAQIATQMKNIRVPGSPPRK